MTSRKGIYFGAALTGQSFSNTFGYMGTGIGTAGLLGRVKNHISTKYRQHSINSDRPKLLYKYTEGLMDGIPRRLSFVAVAFLEASEHIKVISDIVELTFIALLGAMQTDDPSNWYETKAYAALNTSTFVCREGLLPTNRMSPCQRFAIETNANQKDIILDQSAKDQVVAGFIHFQKHPSRPWTIAVVNFSELVQIAVSMKVLQRFQVTEGQDVDDPEAKEAYRLGIEVSGVQDDSQEPWSFWLRRNEDGEDWSERRPSSNHAGICLAMSIIESIEECRHLPVPASRTRLYSSDDVAIEDFVVRDLTSTKEYQHRATYLARE
jgi:hypothetical protein